MLKGVWCLSYHPKFHFYCHPYTQVCILTSDGWKNSHFRQLHDPTYLLLGGSEMSQTEYLEVQKTMSL